MSETVTCGEATIRLLEAYGVDTIFGIPGVHTLDFCRGINAGDITHVQARNEQGAGFMADGFARTTGKPGVCLVISGPGATNALTAVGQSYSDSIPVLMLSSDAQSYSIGKGWGVLHEVPNLAEVTAPLTGFSQIIMDPKEVPDALHRAFSIFASERARPVHIAIPIDVQAMPVSAADLEHWTPRPLPARPSAQQDKIEQAATLLKAAQRPLFCVGGGAIDAASDLTEIAEKLGAAVISSVAGKGIIPDTHPLSLGASTVRPEARDYMAKADVILAIGTELSETDSFVEKMDLPGKIIRIDIDPRKIDDFYSAEIGIVADAAQSASLLKSALGDCQPRPGAADDIASVKKAIGTALSPSEQQHTKALATLRAALSDDVIILGDACQLVYTGAFEFPVSQPRRWHYPAGYCALGPALPQAIGAKCAQPDAKITAWAGDGGFMFTMQELVTAAELKQALPVIIWANGGLKQIQDDMDARDIDHVGVTGINPDFIALARACHCHGVSVESADELASAITTAFNVDRPTLIIITEGDSWLTASA